jgi:hypothetical protein
MFIIVKCQTDKRRIKKNSLLPIFDSGFTISGIRNFMLAPHEPQLFNNTLKY